MSHYKVSYIIPYRKSTEDRDRNLDLTLKWLSNNFSYFEVIIVELDTETKIDKKLLLSNARHIFYFYEGIFNRSLARNIGALNATGDIFVFADNDVIMDPKKFKFCIDMCNDTYDSVHPFSACLDLTEDELKKINPDLKNLSLLYESFEPVEDMNNYREAMPFAGANLIIRRKPFFAIGGWPEETVGWGCEDNILSYKIDRFLTKKCFPNYIYHLPHKRSVYDWYNNPEYKDNYAKMQRIVDLTDDELVNYCKNSRKKLLSFPLNSLRQDEKEELLSYSISVIKERERSVDFTFI